MRLIFNILRLYCSYIQKKLRNHFKTNLLCLDKIENFVSFCELMIVGIKIPMENQWGLILKQTTLTILFPANMLYTILGVKHSPPVHSPISYH